MGSAKNPYMTTELYGTNTAIIILMSADRKIEYYNNNNNMFK